MKKKPAGSDGWFLWYPWSEGVLLFGNLPGGVFILLLPLFFSVTPAFAEPSFDEKYEGQPEVTDLNEDENLKAQ